MSGIRVANFDTTSDKLVAVAGTSIYEGTPSTTPAFGAAVVTGLTAGAVPTFAQAQDRLIFCNGTDENYIREPNGFWRRALMPVGYKPTVTLGGSAGNEWRPNAATGDFLAPEKAYDNSTNYQDTYAYAQTGTAGGAVFTQTRTSTWTFASQAVTDPSVVVWFAFGYLTTGGGVDTSTEGTNRLAVYIGRGTLTLEYKIGAGAWTTFYSGNDPIDKTNASFVATGLTNMQDLSIRVTNNYGTVGLGPLRVAQVFDIYAYDGGTASYTSSYALYYKVAERYIDSDGVAHTSVATLKTDPITLSTTYKVTLTLPGTAGLTNSIAQYYVLYRSVAIDGGDSAYYEIAQVGKAQTSYVDGFSTANDPRIPADGPLYETVDVLNADGVTLPYDANMPPPIASLAVPFHGSTVYLPTSVEKKRRAYYTVNNTQSVTSLTQCPECYYLQFDTPYNDSPTTCVPCNGGRALAFFFDRYTMLVNNLPQASDSGVFDTRVREYISTSRGSAGVQTACEFTLPSGQTLVASVDSLGLWVTNGVSEIMEWSNDFDWLTEMSGVTLSTARLRDNPVKRRLELIYTKSGQNYELHFFYGRLKQDADGKTAPLITGPHIANISDVHYFNVGGTWYGWSAGTSASGKVYNELTGTSDAALSYDASGSIPTVVKTGDSYVTGLGGAHLIEALYPKFESGTATVTVTSTVTRDAGTSRTVANTFAVGTSKKIFQHAYADRHSVQFSHISTSTMPALVGYEIEVRDGGVGRDR